MHLHLLQAMDAVKMGADGHTLLDESVVYFGSEISQPNTHSAIDMPLMLAGAGGGLRGGRWVHYTDKTGNKNSHNNLLVSILNLFGNPANDVRQRRQVRRAARQHHLGSPQPEKSRIASRRKSSMAPRARDSVGAMRLSSGPIASRWST